MPGIERLRTVTAEVGGKPNLLPMVKAVDLAGTQISAPSPEVISAVSKVEHDASGRIRKKTCLSSNGRVTVETDDAQGNLCELDILDKDSSTVIKRTTDPFSTLFVGQRVDKITHAIDDVILARNFLVRLDHKSKAILETERLDYKYNDPSSTPDYVPGQFDADRGSFEFKAKNGYVYKEFMAPGRWDLMDGDKQIFISPFKGESATLSAQSALVKHSDGSSITLKSDGTISLSDAAGQIRRQSLSSEEFKYLAAHPHVDRRDVAAVHERLHDTAELTDFYQQLTRFDNPRNLPREQAHAIEDNLLHEVAYPEEIYQGSMGSCNVTTIQRELAVDRPSLLCQEIYSVAELGKITDINGKVYEQDRGQLLKRDLSGRDVASRIFQSAAIDVIEQQSGKHFKNTMDGVGRVVNMLGGMSKFNGINLSQIANTGYLLEGETHSIVRVKSVAEIEEAMRYQSGRGVVAEVDASLPPFTATTYGTRRSGHVVNITSVQTNEPAPSTLGYENQWGLAFDHSKAQAVVDAESFLHSMSIEAALDGTRRTRAYGQVLVRGLTQNVEYVFVNGGLEQTK